MRLSKSDKGDTMNYELSDQLPPDEFNPEEQYPHEEEPYDAF